MRVTIDIQELIEKIEQNKNNHINTLKKTDIDRNMISSFRIGMNSLIESLEIELKNIAWQAEYKKTMEAFNYEVAKS